MEVCDSESTIIKILIQGLTSKLEIVKELLHQTKIQEELLMSKFSEELFSLSMKRKAELLLQLDFMDEGFEQLYYKISRVLNENKEMYRNEILVMQGLIKEITEKGVLLKALEHQNKHNFVRVVKDERDRICSYKTSNKTATSYYKSVMKLNGEDSYFIDKKR